MKLPPGVYPHRDRFKAQPSIGGKSVYLGLFDTADEAIDEVARAKRVFAEQREERSRNTFRAWALTWLDERETSGAHRSAANDRSRMNRHVLTAEWVDYPIRSIRSSHLVTWVQELERRRATAIGETGAHVASDRPLSAQTVRHVHNLVRRCFADAVLAGRATRASTRAA